ncbi:30S ribosomal protein S4 [Candidatus Kaiserbacteria bacterium]|nr:MAG: 30S ribosomal protein S4 [Candidatus Kaiserbacteria bacterium]
MLSKPKYKICKRLGNGVYEKCQTEKFALSEARVKKTFKRRKNLSDFGRQLLEKQKVRYAYGITEKQLRKYVESAVRTKEPAAELFKGLETRLDNTVYRLGFAPTRRAARQMVSHGHVTVNDKKMTVPSHIVKTGDTISVREASKIKPLFVGNMDTITKHTAPKWLAADSKKLTSSVKAAPEYSATDSIFDFPAVFEFYSR